MTEEGAPATDAKWDLPEANQRAGHPVLRKRHSAMTSSRTSYSCSTTAMRVWCAKWYCTNHRYERPAHTTLAEDVAIVKSDTPAPPTAADTFALLAEGKPIPVIFDTDIGGDIDDTWALIMALQCPELDVRLVAVDSGDTTYRGRLAAKILDRCGRTDVPVAIGAPTSKNTRNQDAWLGDYELDQYPGTVHDDAVDAIVRTIRESADPVTIVAIGPVPNIAAALERAPDIVHNARFVGMHGAVRMGYNGNPDPCPESNVRWGPDELAAVFAAGWECTVTPLDTCGIVRLTGDKYRRVYTCDRPSVRVLMENYRVWSAPWLQNNRPDCTLLSSTLFDCVAVYLAFSEDLVAMEDVPLRVTPDGMTVEEPGAPLVRCAMAWRDLGAFEDLLVDRLVSH